MIEVKVKKLYEDSLEPYKATAGAAAYDVFAHSLETKDHCYIYGTGLAFEIPDNYVIKLYPRSSIYKNGLILNNSVGIIDSDFRGELKVVFKKESYSKAYGKGERIAQIILEKVQEVCYTVTDKLSSTERGENGFGSTNK